METANAISGIPNLALWLRIPICHLFLIYITLITMDKTIIASGMHETMVYYMNLVMTNFVLTRGYFRSGLAKQGCDRPSPFNTKVFLGKEKNRKDQSNDLDPSLSWEDS